MTTAGDGPDAGWYDDPADPTMARYWDGEQWTSRVRPKNATGAGDPPPPSYGAAPSYAMGNAPAYSAQGAGGTNGLAIASLVCGILGCFGISAIVAVVLGHVSLSQLKRPDNNQSGRGMAIAGLVLGYLGIAASVIWLIAVVLSADTTTY